MVSLLTGASSTLDLSAVETAIENSVKLSDINSVIGAILGVSIAYVVLWWGARKVVNSVLDAFRYGSISL